MERSKAGPKEVKRRDGLSVPNQNKTIKLYYFIRYGIKYNEIQLKTKWTLTIKK